MNRPLRLLTGALVVLLIGAGLVWLLWGDRLVYRLGTVRPGVLYRSAQLPVGKLEDVVTRLRIRTIVNLRREDPSAEMRFADEHGIRYAWWPSDQVPSPDVVAAFLDLMDDPGNLPVLVHCEHGVGRTGVLSGIYRLEYDRWPVERVLEEARFYALGGSYFEGQDKTSFLESYRPRWAR